MSRPDVIAALLALLLIFPWDASASEPSESRPEKLADEPLEKSGRLPVMVDLRGRMQNPLYARIRDDGSVAVSHKRPVDKGLPVRPLKQQQ